MKINQKKSAVDLTELAIGIIVLGIVVSISAIILVNFRDSRLTSLTAVTTANETTVMNSSAGADNLANFWGRGITECYCNMTGTQASGFACAGNVTIPAANYTVAVDAGGTMSVINATETVYADPQCTYTTYNISEPEWALPNAAALGIGEYGNWFTILVIVGIAAVVLALIFLAFSNSRGGGSSSGGGGSIAGGGVDF